MNRTPFWFVQRWLEFAREKDGMRRGRAGGSETLGCEKFQKAGRRQLVHVTPAWVCWLELTEVRSYPPRLGDWRPGPHLQVLAGTHSESFWQSWVFSARYSVEGYRYPQMWPRTVRNDVSVCSRLYRPRLKPIREDGSEERGHILVTCTLTTRKKLDKLRTINFSWTYQTLMSEQTANLKFRKRSGERSRTWAFAYRGRHHHIPYKLLGRFR